MLQERKTLWTAYKRHYVRVQLSNKMPKAMIADRLGVTLTQLTQAIRVYGLDKPDPANG